MGILGELLGGISGNAGLELSKQLIFDKVIGFRSVVSGAGASLYVHNVATALSVTTNHTVCVVDANFLYPMLGIAMLETEDAKEEVSYYDMLDFQGDLADILRPTKYPNVHLVSITSNSVVDIFSSRDCREKVNKVLSALKSYFDIILVDLPTVELTNTYVATVIGCNKIYTVASADIKTLTHLRKSYRLLGSLAVPRCKADKVILNKVTKVLNLDIVGVLNEAKLTVVAEVPYTPTIFLLDNKADNVWGNPSGNKETREFNLAIDKIVLDILCETPTNKVDRTPKTDLDKKIWKEKAKLFKRRKKDNNNQSTKKASTLSSLSSLGEVVGSEDLDSL